MWDFRPLCTKMMEVWFCGNLLQNCCCSCLRSTQITAECKYWPLCVSGQLTNLIWGYPFAIFLLCCWSQVFFSFSLMQTCSLYFLPGAASAGHGGGRHEYPSGQEGANAEQFPHLPVSAWLVLYREPGKGSASSGGLSHSQSRFISSRWHHWICEGTCRSC